ncbi:MAG: SMC family ATPase [Chloroflexi bacterium]|nr:SMC family ATPase [Chloroflexota bacterium]
MIPVKLGLRNFMSYTDVHEPLVFEGIHLACLSGENGAGKSTLLDAVTWALWGYSRAGAGSAQQLVHAGRTEMEVEYEFRLAGETYRVLRKWTAPRTGRGSGTTLLDLSILDGDHFRSISGSTIRETDAKIVGLLRMSYTTFTNSAFILQGQADAFTTRTPTQRKEVLGEILELAEYDRLQERAREEVRTRDARHRELTDRLREADAELRERPTYEAERQRLEAEIVEVERRLAEDEAALRAVQESVTRLTARERELDEATNRARQSVTEVERQKKAIADHERAIAGQQRLLENAREIEQGVADLQRTRQADEALSQKLRDLTPLNDERGRLESAIAQARTRLEGELRNVEQHLGRHEREAGKVREYEQAVQKAHQDQGELARIQARQAEVERELATAREEAAELRGANLGLRKEMDVLRSRIDTIQSEPICPICHSQLDPARRERLTAEYTDEGVAQREQYRQNQARAKALDGVIEQKTADQQRLAAEQGQLAGVERRLATAEHALEAAQKSAREVEQARAEVTKLQDQLSCEAYAQDDAAQLREVAARIDALGYDPATHRRIRGELTPLLQYEQLARELDGARREVSLRNEALDAARAALATWDARLAEDKARVLALREEVKDLPALRERQAESEQAVQRLRREHTAASRQLGEAQQRLSYLDRLQETRAERLRELEDVLREKGLYTDLATAFGRNGIQAMLVETAIPEIQDEANRLLAAMTSGRMHVELKTQRERASGDGQIETLDVVIHDNLGSRPYEMYSGGEAFRVNFALRIALSRLLAQRAGARLETLVIDEGFGSQDQEGRDRLVEAIKSIEPEFAMILVITHLDDLKERFPVRIDVQKRPDGSVFQTEWVA